MKYRSLNELNWITDRQNLKRIKPHLTKRVCEWFNDSLPLLPTKGVSERIRIVTILSVNLFKRFETMNQNPHHFCSTVKIVRACRLHEGGDRCYLCLTVPWRWLFPVLKYSVSDIFGDAGRSIHEYSRVSCFTLKRHWKYWLFRSHTLGGLHTNCFQNKRYALKGRWSSAGI